MPALRQQRSLRQRSGALSQLPSCASVALGNNAGKKRKNQMNMALPEGIERPTLKVIGNAALLRALSRRSHKLFIPSLLPEGVQNWLEAPISERSVGLA